eukprot:794859-Rhodomonas_salina.2
MTGEGGDTHRGGVGAASSGEQRSHNASGGVEAHAREARVEGARDRHGCDLGQRREGVGQARDGDRRGDGGRVRGEVHVGLERNREGVVLLGQRDLLGHGVDEELARVDLQRARVARLCRVLQRARHRRRHQRDARLRPLPRGCRERHRAAVLLRQPVLEVQRKHVLGPRLEREARVDRQRRARVGRIPGEVVAGPLLIRHVEHALAASARQRRPHVPRRGIVGVPHEPVDGELSVGVDAVGAAEDCRAGVGGSVGARQAREGDDAWLEVPLVVVLRTEVGVALKRNADVVGHTGARGGLPDPERRKLRAEDGSERHAHVLERLRNKPRARVDRGSACTVGCVAQPPNESEGILRPSCHPRGGQGNLQRPSSVVPLMVGPVECSIYCERIDWVSQGRPLECGACGRRDQRDLVSVERGSTESRECDGGRASDVLAGCQRHKDDRIDAGVRGLLENLLSREEWRSSFQDHARIDRTRTHSREHCVFVRTFVVLQACAAGRCDRDRKRALHSRRIVQGKCDHVLLVGNNLLTSIVLQCECSLLPPEFPLGCKDDAVSDRVCGSLAVGTVTVNRQIILVRKVVRDKARDGEEDSIVGNRLHRDRGRERHGDAVGKPLRVC